ncbi:MAG: oligoendopeptidase F [Spirochaetaceae bacterium]|jgi:oligoendopeptidase F|nr:oligoendopeptidase F [Spirochaetaceae bacterium]
MAGDMVKTVNKIPTRAEIEQKDKWDLSKLFKSDADWDAAFVKLDACAEKGLGFKGTLGKSAENLLHFLDFEKELGILEENLGCYAQLRQSEDEGDGAARTMLGKFMMAYAKIEAFLAWSAPEIQAIPDFDIKAFLADKRLDEYKIYLEKLLRFKPYILSEKEERIIAMQSENRGLADDAFSALTNVDMDFGLIDEGGPTGKLPLTHSTFSLFLRNSDRNVRKTAYNQFYENFDRHKTTIASLYAGSVKNDVIQARIRGFSSARAAALFPDNVPETVYDNLIDTINANLEPLHRYYALRKKALGLSSLCHYDVYVPFVADIKRRHTWNEAVDVVCSALSPLGPEYVDTLQNGLLGSNGHPAWADRYENKGKRSGAFSSGCYTSDPYILINYKEDDIGDVFTLVHEGGHSMHSWYSKRANPFMQYNYSIFEAEVASTFNEELLFRYMLGNAGSDKELKAWLINHRVDDIIGTLYRQTMFAEFEKRTHELEEAGSPLTVELLRSEYRALLTKYFGPELAFEEVSDLEGLRIPHFYNAFYVYKYSTGISAALALAEGVLNGGSAERDNYFAFLKSGGSRYPIEALKVAGVDMSSPKPVEAVCKRFSQLVDELSAYL